MIYHSKTLKYRNLHIKHNCNEKKIFFGLLLEHIGTVKSTMNSALSLKRYCKNYEVYIINTCGEWDSHKIMHRKFNSFIKSKYKLF